jgi:MoaA/NifB/PqqE/SkfB family radical SAM enzyme
MSLPLPLAGRAIVNYLRKRPICASFELTHNCNARCQHCHRGEVVEEEKASPQKLLEVCRQLRPVVAIMSGGEPLMRRDLVDIVRLFKREAAPIRLFINTNAGLLTVDRFRELVVAGIDEVLISFDFPDRRHDEFRRIPGLFDRIAGIIGELSARERQRVVLTMVLHSRNFETAVDAARLALQWGVNINYSAYTWLRTDDRSLMIQEDQIQRFGEVIERLIAFKHAHGNILTSDWVLRTMVRFYAQGGTLPNCRAGEKSLVVNPDGTLSPCGLLVRDFKTHGDLLREFTAKNDCTYCYTSTRGNSERPARYLFLDHLGYVSKRER